MSSIFAVLINGVPELEFDRNTPLPEKQNQFLDVMDKELGAQIVIGDKVITNPDLHERAQFVAINLINALKSGDDGLSAAMCSYLAVRIPDLKKVMIDDQGEQVVIDLVFDEDYVKQVNVEFTSRSSSEPTKH
jgi:hypothetical protein